LEKKGMRDQVKTERMLQLVREWEESGKTQKEFVEEHGIKVHTFQYWITKKKRIGQRDSGNGVKSQGFIELKPSENSCILVRYPNGIELHLPGNTPVSMIKSLLMI
jgi:hypothetical protein